MPPPEAETDNGWPATSIFLVLSVSRSEHWMSHPEAGMGKTQKTESSNGQCGLRTQVNGENTFDRDFASKKVDIIFWHGFPSVEGLFKLSKVLSNRFFWRTSSFKHAIINFTLYVFTFAFDIFFWLSKSRSSSPTPIKNTHPRPGKTAGACVSSTGFRKKIHIPKMDSASHSFPKNNASPANPVALYLPPPKREREDGLESVVGKAEKGGGAHPNNPPLSLSP